MTGGHLRECARSGCIEPRPYSSVYHLLEHHARTAPDSPAILAPGRDPLPYRELFEQVNKAIQTLRHLGVQRRDRVALVMPNGPEMAVALAAVAAGAACVPLNPAFAADQWYQCFDDLGVGVLLIQARMESPARVAAHTLGIPTVDVFPLTGAKAGVFDLTGSRQREIVGDGFGTGEDDAFVLPTSGTTSRPKVVPLTHTNICWSARNTGVSLSLGRQDRLLNVLPLYHAHGLLSGLMASLAAGSSVICTPGFRAREFFAWLEEFRPTWYTAVPAIHQAVLEQAPLHQAAIRRCCLRFVRSASAPLPENVLDRLEQLFGVPVLETYGMTEAASQIASNPMPPRQRKKGSVGIAAGPEVAIMGDDGDRLPAGDEGEIVLRGANITRGYDGDATTNEGAFTNDWLRTGDRGYLDDDGYLFIVGRTKEIINRGGEKIAPRKVEDVLMNHPDVAQAVAFAIPHARLGEDVAAAVVLRPDARATTRNLRDYAKERLAAFEVPRRVHLVAEIPKGTTGKVQRIGLARRLGLTRPASARSTRRACYEAPRTDREERLTEIWANVLGLDGVGIHDDFFSLGGDSLAGVQVISRVRDDFGVNLSFDDFFDAPTVAELAARTEASKEGRDAAAHSFALTPAEDPPAHLSYPQLRLYFLHQLGLSGHSYDVLEVARLAGRLDRSALERSFAALIERHETLRTTFTARDGEPVQVVRNTMPKPMAVVDLGPCTEQQKIAAIESVAREATHQPFDLADGPLFRAKLLRWDDDDHALVITAHHLITDGWSQRIFWDELQSYYEAYVHDHSPSLPALPIRYAQFSEWQRRWLKMPASKTQRDYWRKQLSGLAGLPLPTDRSRPRKWSPRGKRHRLRFSRTLTRKLEALSRSHRVTLFMTLLASFQCLLHRYAGHRDVAVGSLIANRNRTEFESLIGMFVNTVVLRTDFSGDPTFSEVMRRVRRITLEAYRNQDLPFEQVLQAVEARRSLDRSNPLFQVLFVLHNTPPPQPRLPELTMSFMEVDPGTARFDLTLELMESAGCLEGWFEYSTELFEGETIARMRGHLRTMLEAVVDNPDHRVSSLPILTARERRRMLVDWNATRSTLPSTRCVHELFASQAAHMPNAAAVIGDDSSLHLGELNRRANQLAHYLRRKGAGPEQLVGLLANRNSDMIIALLGILKAGAAYVPLDPNYPRKRLALMLEDADIGILVTQEALSDGLVQNDTTVVRLDADWPAIKRESDENPDIELSPDNLAYVLYTSGSSGRPKGVLGTHRGILNMLEWVWRTFPFEQGEVCCHKASISFVDSIQELFGPLLRGVPLVVIEADVLRDPLRLVRSLARHRITRIVVVPSLLKALMNDVEELDRQLPHLKLWISTGEALPADLVRGFRTRLPGRRLVNLYGASETSDMVAWHEIGETDTGVPGPPIGRPIANTEVYVLDEAMEPVPIGIPGELCVAGSGLSRGYLKRPDLEAEKFIPHPFDDGHYPRLYKTGDLARFRADGNLEFLGRRDDQVQVRGCRVELGEVEAALRDHPGVGQAAVVARRETGGDVRLAAYVVTGEPPAPKVNDLHQFARHALPEYMLPSAYVFLKALPITPSGKVDRRALLAMREDVALTHSARGAPRSATEELLASIWGELLEIKDIGMVDNFFELGGHSLLAGQLLSRVRNIFHVSFPVRVLFESPTIFDLACRIDGARRSPEEETEFEVGPVPRDDPLPVSIAQEHVLKVEQALPGLPFFNLPYAFRLRGALNVHAFEHGLNRVIRRHDALRTTFATVGGRRVQAIAPAIEISVKVEDFSAGAGAERARAAEMAAKEEAWTPIDVAREPPLRVRILRLGDDDHVLLLTVHHIVTDGWSMGVFMEELSSFYAAFMDGRGAQLPEPSIQLADYAQWQRQWCDTKAAQSQLSYWREQLRDVSPVFPARGQESEPRLSLQIARAPIHLSRDLAVELDSMSRRQGSTLFITLLAGFKALLRAKTGQEDLCVATIMANRLRQETERVIGPLENPTLIRSRIDGDLSFRDVLWRVRDSVLEAHARQELPFEILARRLEEDYGIDPRPLTQVMFVVQNAIRQPFCLSNIVVRPFGDIYREGQPVLPLTRSTLTLILKERSSGITGTCVYKEDRLASDQVEEMLGGYASLLERVASEPDIPLDRLGTLTPSADSGS